jgi:hypothetical protein
LSLDSEGNKALSLFSFNKCITFPLIVNFLYQHTFLITTENNTLKTIYYNGGFIRLRNVSLTIGTNDKTETIFNYGLYGISIKKYIYQNKLLEKILVKTKEHNKNEYTNYELLFEFTENNLVKIIQSYPNGYKKEIYK